MPLDPEHPPSVGRLDRLWQAVLDRSPGHSETLTQAIDRLMVMAVGDVDALACCARRQRSLFELDVIVGLLEGALAPSVDRLAVLIGKVLDERAAERDVQDLHASTDREHGDAGGQRMPNGADLEVVALAVRLLEARLRARAIAGGIQISPADEEQAVDRIDDASRRARVDRQEHG